MEFDNLFNEWFVQGNAFKVAPDQYIEQSTQWKVKFTLLELREFFKKEYLLT